MEESVDTYRTIAQPSTEVLFKDRKSKFFGYAFPVKSQDEIKRIIERLRKTHPTANHVCYAWQLGTDAVTYRANDDGEPNNSAGMPIYGQIQSFGVTNVLIAVVRFFGGTKLGVGGLIQAYRNTAEQALQASDIIEKMITVRYQIDFDYSKMSTVMRLIKRLGLEIESQKMDMVCSLVISVRRNASEMVPKSFEEHPSITIQRI